jgi:hypothetical protein
VVCLPAVGEDCILLSSPDMSALIPIPPDCDMVMGALDEITPPLFRVGKGHRQAMAEHLGLN